MKIKFVRSQKYKLFKYNLLKSQVYADKHVLVNPSYSLVLDQTEAYLKQILKIIFEYHIKHLRILFLGFPIFLNSKHVKFIHFTNHFFISDKSWVNGIFRNRFSILTYLRILQSQSFSNKLRNFLMIKAKPHLVILFYKELKLNTVNEFYKCGIPLITVNCGIQKSLNQIVTYKIPGNFDFTKKSNSLFYSFLFYSLLKCSPLNKKGQIQKFCKIFSNSSI